MIRNSLPIHLLAAVTVVSLFLLAAATVPAAADPDPRCDEYSGAARGLCRAAASVGCFEDPTLRPCEKLARNFERHTGQTPPWMEVACPCYTAEDVDGWFVQYIAEPISEPQGWWCDPPEAIVCRPDVGLARLLRYDQCDNAPRLDIKAMFEDHGYEVCAAHLSLADGTVIVHTPEIPIDPDEQAACAAIIAPFCD